WRKCSATRRARGTEAPSGHWSRPVDGGRSISAWPVHGGEDHRPRSLRYPRAPQMRRAILLAGHQAAARPAHDGKGPGTGRRPDADFRADPRCDRGPDTLAAVEPGPRAQAMMHVDTSFLVHLLRESRRRRP